MFIKHNSKTQKNDDISRLLQNEKNSPEEPQGNHLLAEDVVKLY